MGWFEYEQSKEIASKEYSWLSLLFALIRKSDSNNAQIIKENWPEHYEELVKRYNVPGGHIPDID